MPGGEEIVMARQPQYLPALHFTKETKRYSTVPPQKFRIASRVQRLKQGTELPMKLHFSRVVRYAKPATGLLIVLLVTGCASGPVTYNSPKDENLELDSPASANLRTVAQQTADDGRRLVAEGLEQLKNAREQIIFGERMVAEGHKMSAKAAGSGSAEQLDRAASKILEGNEIILVHQQEIAAAQRKIRDGRVRMNTAAGLLRELGDDRISAPEASDRVIN
jgi:hypothetical protein